MQGVELIRSILIRGSLRSKIMSIKQSVLEKKWYYRVAKVLFLWIVPIFIVFALLAILYSGAGSATDAGIFAGVSVVYLLVLKGVWRGFLYLVFGGLDDDTKKKVIATVRSTSPAAPAQTPTQTSPQTPAKPDTKIDVPGIIRIIVGGILSLVALWAFMQFIFSLNSNTDVTPGGNTNGGNPLCSNRCPAYAPYYCTGQYYDADGIKRSLNGCLPVPAANAGYSSWEGRCIKCP